MAERGTVGHGKVNAFYFPVKQTATVTYTNAQFDRLQNLGLGAFDLAQKDIYEIGRKTALVQVSSPTIDKPATLEWNESGSLRPWNLIFGKAHDNSGDIDMLTDGEADNCEGVLLVHKLDDDATNVVESHVLWRMVPESIGISTPNSKEDEVSCSARLTGEYWLLSANAAGKAVVEYKTANASVLTPTSAALVERDDWPDGETEVSTTLSGDEVSGQTELSVTSTANFKVGQLVMIKADANNWEISTIESIGSGAVTIADALDNSYSTGDAFKTTRGVTVFIHNSTDQTEGDAGWMVEGTDYRAVCTTGATTIINCDDGTAIGASDVCVLGYLLASAAEEWTDNDSDLTYVRDPQTKLVVSPNSDYSSSQELRRGQGYDIAVTFNRTVSYESGSKVPIRRALDSVEPRLTFPGYESDITTFARLAAKDPTTVKTMRPEQSPKVYVRDEIYLNDNRYATDIKVCYELPEAKRTGGENTQASNEQGTKRITVTATNMKIASSL